MKNRSLLKNFLAILLAIVCLFTLLVGCKDGSIDKDGDGDGDKKPNVPSATHYDVTYVNFAGDDVASEQSNKVVQVQNGGKIGRDDPYRDGKIFIGYYLDSAYTAEFNFETQIKADRKIYLKWEGYTKKNLLEKNYDNALKYIYELYYKYQCDLGELKLEWIDYTHYETLSPVAPKKSLGAGEEAGVGMVFYSADNYWIENLINTGAVGQYRREGNFLFAMGGPAEGFCSYELFTGGAYVKDGFLRTKTDLLADFTGSTTLTLPNDIKNATNKFLWVSSKIEKVIIGENIEALNIDGLSRFFINPERVELIFTSRKTEYFEKTIIAGKYIIDSKIKKINFAYGEPIKAVEEYFTQNCPNAVLTWKYNL